jgi:hypothetical protein
LSHSNDDIIFFWFVTNFDDSANIDTNTDATDTNIDAADTNVDAADTDTDILISFRRRQSYFAGLELNTKRVC